jgi:hypothetical protein
VLVRVPITINPQQLEGIITALDHATRHVRKAEEALRKNPNSDAALRLLTTSRQKLAAGVTALRELADELKPVDIHVAAAPANEPGLRLDDE